MISLEIAISHLMKIWNLRLEKTDMVFSEIMAMESLLKLRKESWINLKEKKTNTKKDSKKLDLARMVSFRSFQKFKNIKRAKSNRWKKQLLKRLSNSRRSYNESKERLSMRRKMRKLFKINQFLVFLTLKRRFKDRRKNKGRRN